MFINRGILKIISGVLVFLSLLMVLSPVRGAITTITSSFDTDDEGWATFGDTGGVIYNATGGNPDGMICVNDLAQGIVWYFLAPSKFNGNLVDAYGQNLTFDLKQSILNNQINDSDVVLIGSDITLTYDTAYNPGTNWTSYSIPIIEGMGWINTGTQNPATKDDLLAVLSNLDTLRIRGEFRSGTDKGCLDNVNLTLQTSTSTPIELLDNGGFETLDGSNKPILTPWKLTGKGLIGDKIKCNKPGKPPIANSGNCAFRFKGSIGEKAKLSQTVNLNGLTFTSGEALSFQLFYKTSQTSIKARVRANYNDGTPKTSILLSNFVSTTVYDEIESTLNLSSANVAKIVVVIQFKGNTGKFTVDDVSLTKPASLLALPE